jgi:hypothetical protein
MLAQSPSCLDRTGYREIVRTSPCLCLSRPYSRGTQSRHAVERYGREILIKEMTIGIHVSLNSIWILIRYTVSQTSSILYLLLILQEYFQYPL